ncbi:MAG: helix-turn-helix transcriptional regulator [Christensenellales bacterium]|nr:helix-turn-helix transcriptional regulator [Christensenellales bacterium]
MDSVSLRVGMRIREARRVRGMTLQQLADAIHKSRASVSKYENGEITLDVETLCEIGRVLCVPAAQLLDDGEDTKVGAAMPPDAMGHSPFFQADRLYFYFYDGRYQRLKTGVIHIHKDSGEDGGYRASLSISAVTSAGRSGEVFYTGKVVYSDMLIRFSFVNQYNALEEDLLYIFNPMERRDTTDGLLCGISSADLMPCAFRCMVTLAPQEPTDTFIRALMITPGELRRWKKLNMLIVDNQLAR